MPWQQHVALVAGELVVDEEASSMLGREIWVPAYPEDITTIPRQSGKTSLIWSRINHRALRWKAFDRAAQSIAYTAQSGSDGRKKFRKELEPRIHRSQLWRYVRKPRFSAEDTGLDYRNDAVFSVWNTAQSSGHGDILDYGVLDELFDDEDDRREQAFVPAMATRHDRQKSICSTAEDARGVVLRRKRTSGRAAVDAGRREGTAYFEWSADPKDDPESPETWRGMHPALGHTITVRTIKQALDEMRGEDGDLTEFKRAWLNIPVDPAMGAKDGAIAANLWAGVCVDDPESNAPASLAIAVAPQDEWGALAACDGRVVKLLAHRRGPDLGWLVEMANSLSAQMDLRVVFQAKGPAGHLERRLDRPDPVDFNTFADSCATFAAAVTEQLVIVRREEALDAAVEGSSRKFVGDRWVWDRRTADVTPLEAVSLAYAKAQAAPPVFEPMFART